MKTRLKNTLAVQSYSHQTEDMIKFILDFCQEHNLPHEIEDGNIYITKGTATSYACIIAHTDTVHEIEEDLTVIELNGNLIGINSYSMQQTGIGGDDKCGIFIALECLLIFDCLKVAFFRDEEIGCQGSYEADMKFFDSCNFVLQCDRKGNADFITNASGVELSDKYFQDAIKPILDSHKYKFESGMMTDVMALKENGLQVVCANISCGYYNPHQVNEYVNIKDVFNCLSLVIEIIKTVGHTRYDHQAPFKINWTYETNYNNFECDSCGNITGSVQYSAGYNANLCDDCFDYAQKTDQYELF